MNQRQHMSNMLAKALSNSAELKSRILFLLGALIVYRIGSHIALPGVDAVALEIYQETQNSGLFGMFNAFTGGALSRVSLFSLSVFPYISASIIMMILKISIPYLKELSREGSKGNAKIEQYTKYLAVIIAFAQGFGIAKNAQSQQVNFDGGVLELVADKSLMFPLHAALTIVAATLFLKWLGDRITSKGLHNGLSVFIFAGIVAAIPASIAQTVEMANTGTLSGFAIVGIILWVIAMIAFVCFVEGSERRLTLKNPRALSQAKQGQIDFSNDAYLPFKVNMAGVMPVIFAVSIIMGFTGALTLMPESELAVSLSSMFARGSIGYIVLYALTILIFTFVFASIIFNSEEQAENLKKSGSFIPGIRPGKPTAMYFDYFLTRLTVIGAAYLMVVCVLPEIVGFQSALALSFSGTSILIVVTVVMGMFGDIQRHIKEQIQTELMNRHSLKKGPKRKIQR